MKQRITFLTFSCVLLHCNMHISLAQFANNLFESTQETVVMMPQGKQLGFAGYFNDNIADYKKTHPWRLFYSINENNFSIDTILKNIHIAESSNLYSFAILDSCIFYRKIYFDINNPSDDGYSQFMLNYGNAEFKLDSVFNADKIMHSSYSSDKKKLIINTLSLLPEHYSPEIDDQFIIYDLEDIQHGHLKRTIVPCQYCSNGYLIGDRFFFTKSNERDDQWGGFEWTDIYSAPWGNIDDTVRIATRSKIIAITPNGKYILAERQDMVNSPIIIIDVENKKYQLLLGRMYNNYRMFYSYTKNKFAFTYKNKYIVYIDFPKEYPFDALIKHDPAIPQIPGFYEQFQHTPLE